MDDGRNSSLEEVNKKNWLIFQPTKIYRNIQQKLI